MSTTALESVRAFCPQEVGDLLASKLGLQDAVQQIVDEEIDGEAFLDTTKEDWIAMGLKRGTAIKVCKLVHEIKAGEAVAVSSGEAALRVTTGPGQALVEQAFFGPYVGDKRPLQVFLSQLQNYAARWDPSKFHSPYTSLVQSSGWGKSKAIYQLGAEMGVYVVYCSFLPADSDGFPKRTPHVVTIFQEGFTSLGGVAYLIASAEVVAQSGLDPAAWMEKQMKQADEVGKLILDRYNLVLSQLNANLTEGDLTAELQAAVAQVHGNGLKLLYAFDEARLMASWPDYFLELRRSLRLLPGRTRRYKPACFAIFCGTSSKVANYSPTSQKDLSTKVAKKGLLLFPPLRFVSWPDTFVRKRKRDSSVPLGFMFGRPMWGAFGVQGMRAEELVSLAISKMLGGEQIANFSSDDEDEEDKVAAVTPALAAALFGVTVGTTVVCSSSLVQDMVSGHMATLVWVSEDRELLRLCPTSEPVLGEAVARLFMTYSYFRPALSRLVKLCDDGLVLEGVRGELVARILVLLAMYKAAEGTTDSTFFTTPVTVADFFEALLGSEAAAKLKLENGVGPASRTFMDGKICFNHFLPMARSTHGTERMRVPNTTNTTYTYMPQDKLRQFYERSAAFMFAEGEWAAEFGIPISVESAGVPASDSMCDVQVKNVKDALSPKKVEDVGAKLTAHAGADAITLVLCFSPGLQKIQVNGSEVVVIGGPELYPCATDYVDLLLLLLKSRSDVQLEKLLTGDELEVAKNMVPWLYKTELFSQ